MLTDCSEIDREIDAAMQETEVVAALVQRCVDENSQTALDQDAYLARYNALVERYEEAKGKLKALQKKRTERLQKADTIGGFMFALMERDAPPETFTDGLWIDSIDLITIQGDGTLVFQFKEALNKSACAT